MHLWSSRQTKFKFISNFSNWSSHLRKKNELTSLLLRTAKTIWFDSKFRIIVQYSIRFEMKKHYSHSTKFHCIVIGIFPVTRPLMGRLNFCSYLILQLYAICEKFWCTKNACFTVYCCWCCIHDVRVKSSVSLFIVQSRPSMLRVLAECPTAPTAWIFQSAWTWLMMEKWWYVTLGTIMWRYLAVMVKSLRSLTFRYDVVCFSLCD